MQLFHWYLLSILLTSSNNILQTGAAYADPLVAYTMEVTGVAYEGFSSNNIINNVSGIYIRIKYLFTILIQG